MSLSADPKISPILGTIGALILAFGWCLLMILYSLPSSTPAVLAAQSLMGFEPIQW